MDGFIIVGRNRFGQVLYARPCLVCGKPAIAIKSIIKLGRGKFCSVACFAKGRRRRPFDARFWSKVDKNGPTPSHRPELGPCWEWQGGKVKGYGTFRVGKGHTKGAHVVAHCLANKVPILVGHSVCVLHKCDNKPCCNPAHLMTGTLADNVSDMMTKGRHRALVGELLPHTKLTAAKVIEIRRRRAAGETLQALADEFSVAHSSIGKVASRRSWRHVK